MLFPGEFHPGGLRVKPDVFLVFRQVLLGQNHFLFKSFSQNNKPMFASQKLTRYTLEEVALYPPSAVYQWATTLVIAPHPDDETLCGGGAIALLRQMGYRVHVMILSDGVRMHPRNEFMNSREFSAVRKYEAENALFHLGVSSDSVTFLSLNDSLIPARQEAGFEEVVRLCRNKLADLKPDTILAPWRRDFHRDHQAAWQITRQALSEESMDDVKLVEYTKWALYADIEEHLPTKEEVQPWRLNIKPVMKQKNDAMGAYEAAFSFTKKQSRLYKNLRQDEMKNYFMHPWELFLDQPAEC
jgi:LmbE family N-acetylglucosaminyl deacetylase